MIAKGKTRITVTLSDEIVSRLETYGKAMGLNRSAICCYMIGQQIMALDKAYGIADSLGEQLGRALLVNDSLVEK